MLEGRRGNKRRRRRRRRRQRRTKETNKEVQEEKGGQSNAARFATTKMCNLTTRKATSYGVVDEDNQ